MNGRKIACYRIEILPLKSLLYPSKMLFFELEVLKNDRKKDLEENYIIGKLGDPKVCFMEACLLSVHQHVHVIRYK